VALAQRASFFQALGPALDWYQGGPATELPGWGSGLSDPEGVRGRIARLQEWLASVPGPERMPGLEALLMLSSPRDTSAPDRAALLETASEHMHQVPRDQVLAWLERETEHGRYGVDRTAVALLARKLGPDAYERVLGHLEAWVARTSVNEGTSAWHTLHELGEGARAEAAAQASKVPR
jgi:hypothetical protein